MQYINLTPHNVVVYCGETFSTIVPSGAVARLKEITSPCGTVDGIPRISVFLTEAIGLPESKDGVVYIVSMPFLMGMIANGSKRTDIVYPFDQVRDESGRIIGCRSLASLATTV